MEPPWTLPELVAEVSTRIAALPTPRNGQVRAIPDDRTVRYYGTIGLLDRPSAMRGRTALYGLKHVAQVVAIKRLQAMGRSLSEIQTLWPTLDAVTLARMSGVELETPPPLPARAEFWKREPRSQGAAGPIFDLGVVASAVDDAGIVGAAASPQRGAVIATPGTSGGPVVGVVIPVPAPAATVPAATVELRVELAPNVILSLSIVDDSIAVSPADVRALRAAAAPLVAELASRRLAPHPGGEEP